MNKNQLQDKILAIIRTVFDDKKALERIHTFLMDEIYQEPEPEEIPEKYKKAVAEMADSLLTGLVCFFNPETLEIEFIPKDLAYDPEEYEMVTGETLESAGLKHEDWPKCIDIEAMESSEAYLMMENFTDEIGDDDLRNQLLNALDRRKPFANFKHIVENSTYRQQWFDFRQKSYEESVWNTIRFEIEQDT